MKAMQEKLVQMVDRMPAFPQSVHRILQLTSDIDCSPRDLVNVIDHDPVITLKILKLVNSAYFGLARKIISINQAVVFVGINTIKNLALSVATMGMLPKQTQGGLNMTRFLLHSLGCATTARMLSQSLGIAERESADYFVAGLLHDFGKVVFARFIPQEFERALELARKKELPLHMAENEIIGATHNQIGAMLGEKWQLPGELVACIKTHHVAPDELDKVSNLLLAVMTANAITKTIGFGDSGSPVVEPIPEKLLERFNVKELPELMASLGDIEGEMEKTRVFTQL